MNHRKKIVSVVLSALFAGIAGVYSATRPETELLDIHGHTVWATYTSDGHVAAISPAHSSEDATIVMPLEDLDTAFEGIHSDVQSYLSNLKALGIIDYDASEGTTPEMLGETLARTRAIVRNFSAPEYIRSDRGRAHFNDLMAYGPHPHETMGHTIEEFQNRLVHLESARQIALHTGDKSYVLAELPQRVEECDDYSAAERQDMTSFLKHCDQP